MAWRWWREGPPDDGRGAWRRQWEAAATEPSGPQVAALERSLEALALPADDLEVEHEMLEGLRALIALDAGLGAALPVIETGHRIVGTDACHFSAPASRADDGAQPAGRLLLTSRRALFVGGASALTVPWHAVGEVSSADRDLVVARRDRDAVHVFRCNSYADVLCARRLAGRLAAAHRPTRHV